MGKIKYNYEGFTDVENEAMRLVKEFRSFVKKHYPDANYIRVTTMNLKNGYIDLTIGDSTPEEIMNDLNLVVWDKEGIEDEQTDTDE